MGDNPEIGESPVDLSPSPARPGEDHANILRRSADDDRHGRRHAVRGWRGFPLTERSWQDGSIPALSHEEALCVRALLMLNVLSCRGWGRLAERAGDAELRWRFARNAQIRDDCANDLQEILCEAGEDIAYPDPIGGSMDGPGRWAGPALEGSALARAVRELEEHEDAVRRKYEEMLVGASPPLHAVLARQWRSCREINWKSHTRMD